MNAQQSRRAGAVRPPAALRRPGKAAGRLTPAARRRPARRRPGASDGFTVIEVILSLAILVGGVLAASRLINIGLEDADLARAQSLAVLLAQSKMAELEVGLSDDTGTEGEFEDHPGFTYAVEKTPSDVERMEVARVSVTFRAEEYEHTYTLVRWLFKAGEEGAVLR